MDRVASQDGGKKIKVLNSIARQVSELASPVMIIG
jgi:hypothetical protein